MKAVSKDGDALHFVAMDPGGDREVVLTAVTNDWYALGYATEDLRGDGELVMRAMGRQGGGTGCSSVAPVGWCEGTSGNCLLSRLHSGSLSPYLYGMGAVLRRCAELLNIGPDVVERHGSLMWEKYRS